MSLHPFRSFGTRTAALATAGVLAATAIGAFPAAAQQALSRDDCRTANVIATEIYGAFKTRGGLSTEFTGGINAWLDGGCAGTIKTKVVLQNDEAAAKILAGRIVALRMAAKPAALSN